MPDYPIFAQSDDQTVVRHGFYGQSGWYAVPNGYYHRITNGQIFASPNSDFSNPVFSCKYDADGTLVFQDLGRSRLCRQ